MANPVIDLINQEREKVGAKPLVEDRQLNEAAQRQGTFMGNSDSETTNNSDGSTTVTRAKDAGFSGNVQEATGISPIGSSPQVAADNLLANSRDIILNPEATKIGLGQGNDTDAATPETFTSAVVGTDNPGTQIMEPAKANLSPEANPSPDVMESTNQVKTVNSTEGNNFQQNSKDIITGENPSKNNGESKNFTSSTDVKDPVTGFVSSVGDVQNFQPSQDSVVNPIDLFKLCTTQSNMTLDPQNQGIFNCQMNSQGSSDMIGAPINPMGNSDMMAAPKFS